MNDDERALAFATLSERVALARVLARLSAACTDGRATAGFVAAALQQIAVVLDHDRRAVEAALLRECATRLGGAAANDAVL